MREYNIFIIKEEFSNVYRNNGDVLYKTLENLYFIKKEELNYGISLYKQLCLPFNIDVLINYFNHQYMVKSNDNMFLCKSENEKTYIKIKYSHCTLISNKNFPFIFRIFNYYSKQIFICDFKNKDYFWLSKYYNKNVIYEYN